MVPTVIDHTAKVKHDGLIYELHLPNIGQEKVRKKVSGKVSGTDFRGEKDTNGS